MTISLRFRQLPGSFRMLSKLVRPRCRTVLVTHFDKEKPAIVTMWNIIESSRTSIPYELKLSEVACLTKESYPLPELQRYYYCVDTTVT